MNSSARIIRTVGLVTILVFAISGARSYASDWFPRPPDVAEAPEYVAYTYVLLGADSTAQSRERSVATIASFTASKDWAPDRRDLTEHEALVVPVSRAVAQDAGPDVLLASYDFVWSGSVIDNLPGHPGSGPLLLTTTSPLGASTTLDAPFLVQDLSTASVDVIPKWIGAYRSFVTETSARMRASALSQVAAGMQFRLAGVDPSMTWPRLREWIRFTDPVDSVDPIGLHVEVLVPNSEYLGSRTPPQYRVWFATNRRLVDPQAPSQGFGAVRDGQIHYGVCYVAVPRSHTFGSIGSSWVRRVLTLTDDRLKLTRIDVMSDTEYFDWMSDKLDSRQPGARDALIYIHGYNVTFEEAAIRTAQMGYDLKVEGVTAFFSWPSKGSYLGYKADEASIQASEPHLEEFLTRMLLESDAERVHVVAHSMGNRGLLRSVARVLSQAAQSGKKFAQIFLAAPDVDQTVFQNLADVYPRVSERTTLYVSAQDRALGISGFLAAYPRAGYFPPVTLVQDVDTIKVSDIDLTIMGHSYYAEAEAILYDMQSLMQRNDDPRNRPRLRGLPLGTSPSHWEFMK
jgi:esterase/lipase superfamily enzyme